jgi:phage-related protein
MGKSLGMPQLRPMPTIGARCHELRIQDAGITRRLVYRTDPGAVVILEVFGKKTRTTPRDVIDLCRRRPRDYDNA